MSFPKFLLTGSSDYPHTKSLAKHRIEKLRRARRTGRIEYYYEAGLTVAAGYDAKGKMIVAVHTQAPRQWLVNVVTSDELDQLSLSNNKAAA